MVVFHHSRSQQERPPAKALNHCTLPPGGISKKRKLAADVFFVSLWAVKLPKYRRDHEKRNSKMLALLVCYILEAPLLAPLLWLTVCCLFMLCICDLCICVCDCLSICYVINSGYPAMLLGEWWVHLRIQRGHIWGLRVQCTQCCIYNKAIHIHGGGDSRPMH